MKNSSLILAFAGMLIMLAAMAAHALGAIPDGWDKLAVGGGALMIFAAFRDPAYRAQYRWSRWLRLIMLVGGGAEIVWGLVILL